MKIEQSVVEVLKACTINDLSLQLPGQLDRKLYEKTAKLLKQLGGKWVSSKKAFIFKEYAGDIISGIIESGEYTSDKKAFQFFPTPDALAAQLVEMARIKHGEICLEPSAGRGAIARHLPDPMCVELDPKNREFLIAEGFNVVGDDFMTYTPEKVPDVIVMNPPFCKCQDAIHIAKAIEMARRCVVAVASSSVAWKNDRHCERLRQFVKQYGGFIKELPQNSFKESGTAVNTVVVFVEKC